MQRSLFDVEPEPVEEPRRQRARQQVVREIRTAHAERDARAARQPDNAEFRRRAWLVMAGEELIDAVDPQDGVTLSALLERLVQEFTRDVSVWRANRLVAVVTGKRWKKLRVNQF